MPLVALHDKLMCSADHVYIISYIELGDHIWAKQIASTSRAYSPSLSVWINSKHILLDILQNWTTLYLTI